MTDRRYKVFEGMKEIPIPDGAIGILPDTNFWIYIYGDVDYGNKKTGAYSKFYSIAKKQELPLFTTPVVVSEFHNRLIKAPFLRKNLELKNSGEQEIRWKEFRDTDEGSEAFSGANDNVSYILDDCNVIDLITGHDWLKPCCDRLNTTRGELNDEYIRKVCQDNNLALATDDYDFAKSSLHIYSANHRFF